MADAASGLDTPRWSANDYLVDRSGRRAKVWGVGVQTYDVQFAGRLHAEPAEHAHMHAGWSKAGPLRGKYPAATVLRNIGGSPGYLARIDWVDELEGAYHATFKYEPTGEEDERVIAHSALESGWKVASRTEHATF